MLYHFEFRGKAGWEAFGSGEGSDEDRVAVALGDLTAVAGAILPAGEYRYIAAHSDCARWESIWVGDDGAVLSGDEEATIDV